MICHLGFSEPVPLKLMTFNVWRGGDQVNLQTVVDTIRLANPDIVAIQEAEENFLQIGDMLGWSHVNPRTQLLSKYPILDPELNEEGMSVEGEGGFSHPYSYIEITPGKVIAVSNVHLTAKLDGPESLRDGLSEETVFENEHAIRVPQIRSIVSCFAKMELPIFILGDFNSPSHLDSTFPWPTCKELTEKGFIDSFRQLHPEIKSNPGFTWTCGHPFPRLEGNEVMSRIDYVFYRGAVTPTKSYVLGEKFILPWPSDHRAVVSEFLVEPSVAPCMISLNKRILSHLQKLQVRFTGQNGRDLKLEIEDQFSVQLDETDRSLFSLNAEYLKAGWNEATIIDHNHKIQCRASFCVTNEAPEISFSDDIVSWKNSPGNKWDWIGIYKLNETDPHNYLSYFYTDASIHGSSKIEIPPVGNYELRLYANDSFFLLNRWVLQSQ
jgi:endonuclease/exonuclease/phosphatase family metal-dependent hydrolase